MKIKTIILLFPAFLMTSCIDDYLGPERIKGQAVIVDNFKDKNPLDGICIEIVYTKDEGYTYHYLSNSVTDTNGYFEIDTEYKAGYFNIDSWAIAYVYSDSEYSDTLGSFRFQFPANTYDYKTIHLDTFCLSHNIWVIPRISSIGDYQPDEVSINFYNCELVDTSFINMTYAGSVEVNQQFSPVEIIMSMNMQHWLSYGTREFAFGTLKIESEEIGFGYFKLKEYKHTIEGDTLYLDFDFEQDNFKETTNQKNSSYQIIGFPKFGAPSKAKVALNAEVPKQDEARY